MFYGFEIYKSKEKTNVPQTFKIFFLTCLTADTAALRDRFDLVLALAMSASARFLQAVE